MSQLLELLKDGKIRNSIEGFLRPSRIDDCELQTDEKHQYDSDAENVNYEVVTTAPRNSLTINTYQDVYNYAVEDREPILFPHGISLMELIHQLTRLGVKYGHDLHVECHGLATKNKRVILLS